MALAGLGAGLTMVSTYGRSHAAALRLGYKDNICTYLLISSKSIYYFQNQVQLTLKYWKSFDFSRCREYLCYWKNWTSFSFDLF